MKQNSEDLSRNNLKYVAGGAIYGRGINYYRSGHVQSIRVFLIGSSKNKIEVRGEVMGTDNYKASLVFDLQNRKFEDLECTCPYEFDCKHSVALGLKFIDLFGEFFKQTNGNNHRIDAGNLREDLIEWINDQDLAREYAFDEYDEGRDSFVDGGDDEIIEGEFEDIDEYYKNRTKEELMDELENANSIGDMPQEVIDRLIREIANKEEIEKLNKNNVIILPPAKCAKKQGTLFPETAFEKNKFNINSYYIVIKNDRYGDGISDIEIRRTNHSIARPGIVLEEYDNLTEAQKKLFKFLKSTNLYYGNAISCGKLFGLLRDSEIRVFWDRKSGTEDLLFEKETENEKIKVELNLESRIYGYREKAKKEFVFSLDDDYKKIKSFLLFFDRDYLVKKENKNISFHKLSEPLVKLLSRVRLEKHEYYGYGKPFETVLKEEEIIKLNQIIEDGNKYLNLKTN